MRLSSDRGEHALLVRHRPCGRCAHPSMAEPLMVLRVGAAAAYNEPV